MIVDAHAHIFRQLRGRIAAGPVRARGYGRISIGDDVMNMLPPVCAETAFPPDVLIAQMDAAGVGRAVLLQGSFYGDQNTEVLEAVRAHPDRFIAAAFFDPWEDGSRDKFEAIHRAAGFRALKLEMSESTGFTGIHPDAQLGDANLAWLWSELEARGLTLVVDLGAVGSRSYQTAAVRDIAEQHPALRIVVAHLGQITPRVEADARLLAQWHEQIALGLLPNVWFDLASLPAYLPDEDYPYSTAQRYIRRAIERIGPSKVMWGSDVPGLLAQASYPQLLNLARSSVEFLTPDEQALVLGGNALRVYAN